MQIGNLRKRQNYPWIFCTDSDEQINLLTNNINAVFADLQKLSPERAEVFVLRAVFDLHVRAPGRAKALLRLIDKDTALKELRHTIAFAITLKAPKGMVIDFVNFCFALNVLDKPELSLYTKALKLPNPTKILADYTI